jgi:hypothetical protein
MWIPCEPTQPGAVQITLLELDAQGLASKVWIRKHFGDSWFSLGTTWSSSQEIILKTEYDNHVGPE